MKDKDKIHYKCYACGWEGTDPGERNWGYDSNKVDCCRNCRAVEELHVSYRPPTVVEKLQAKIAELEEELAEDEAVLEEHQRLQKAFCNMCERAIVGGGLGSYPECINCCNDTLKAQLIDANNLIKEIVHLAMFSNNTTCANILEKCNSFLDSCDEQEDF